MDRSLPHISIEGAEFFAERDRVAEREPTPVATAGGVEH
jgi:hypothetical protein